MGHDGSECARSYGVVTVSISYQIAIMGLRSVSGTPKMCQNWDMKQMIMLAKPSPSLDIEVNIEPRHSKILFRDSRARIL